MLSTVYASEMQFRHDALTRDRELALLASIRERRAAETVRARAKARVALAKLRVRVLPGIT